MIDYHGGIEMTINKEQNGTTLNIALEGRLDTNTSPDFEKELQGSLDRIEELILNFSKLDYISSAGLRVLLSTQKQMNKQGTMVIRNVNETISEVFEITGFVDILTIE